MKAKSTSTVSRTAIERGTLRRVSIRVIGKLTVATKNASSTGRKKFCAARKPATASTSAPNNRSILPAP